MSETHDHGEGWTVQDGEVMPPDDATGMVEDEQAKEINSSIMSTDPEFEIHRAVGPAKELTQADIDALEAKAGDEGLTAEEAAAINKHYGGSKYPSKPFELPGQSKGRSNWHLPKSRR